MLIAAHEKKQHPEYQEYVENFEATLTGLEAVLRGGEIPGLSLTNVWILPGLFMTATARLSLKPIWNSATVSVFPSTAKKASLAMKGA